MLILLTSYPGWAIALFWLFCIGVSLLAIAYLIAAIQVDREMKEHRRQDDENSFKAFDWRDFKNEPWNEKNN